jgi:hypothetical protein
MADFLHGIPVSIAKFSCFLSEPSEALRFLARRFIRSVKDLSLAAILLGVAAAPFAGLASTLGVLPVLLCILSSVLGLLRRASG